MCKRVVRKISLLALVAISSVNAWAQAPQGAWFPNKQVRAMAVADGIAYLGGDFDYVGPPTGSLALPRGVQPSLSLGGVVRAMVSDGRGGWYVGGSDLLPGGVRLVHIHAKGVAGPVALPQPNAEIEALLRVGNTLYVGGRFTAIGGAARSRAAAVDITTGRVTAWDPNVQASDYTPVVLGLARAKQGVYIGGQWQRAGGQALAHMALVDATTGTPLSWNAAIGELGYVRAIVPQGERVYIGGALETVGGQTRSHLAALDAGSGAVLAWAPRANGFVRALATDGATVWAGGFFSSMNGAARLGMAAVRADDGSVLPFDARLQGSTAIEALVLDGTSLWAGGGFAGARGVVQQRLVAVQSLTGELAAQQFHASDNVSTLALDPAGQLAVGGRFTSVGGQPRGRGAAIDLASGLPTAWDPRADGSLLDLVARDGRVYAVGCFRSIGGAADRYYAAELDGTTGSATPWSPPAHDAICTNAVAVSAGDVYIGGRWVAIGNQIRPGLARLSRSTGAVTSTNISTNEFGEVLTLSLNERAQRLYVGGAFETVAGQPRNALAEINLQKHLVTGFDARIQPGGWVETLAASGRSIYYGGVFASVRGQTRQNMAASSLATGALLAWSPRGDSEDTTLWQPYSLLVRPEAVYIGGYLLGANAQTGHFALAVDPTLGKSVAWAARLTGGNAALDTQFRITAMAISGDDHLAIAGGGLRFTPSPRVNFGLVPRAGLVEQQLPEVLQIGR